MPYETPVLDAWETGSVENYDPRSGMATIRTENRVAKLWSGAFFSGLPVRNPKVGDTVRIQLKQYRGEDVHAVVGRLIGA